MEGVKAGYKKKMLTKSKHTKIRERSFRKKRVTKLIRVGENTHSALHQLSKEQKKTISKLTDELLLQNIPDVYFAAKAIKKYENKARKYVNKANQRSSIEQEANWREEINEE